MITLQDNANKVGSSFYYGERGDWFIVQAIHRDSDCLSRSNFGTALKRLGGESEFVVIERFSHWAVGWVDYLLISPDAKDKIEIGAKIESDIERYPVLDETDFSNLEWEVANNYWKTESPEYRYQNWVKDAGLPKSAAKLSLSSLCDRYSDNTMVQELVQRLAE